MVLVLLSSILKRGVGCVMLLYKVDPHISLYGCVVSLFLSFLKE